MCFPWVHSNLWFELWWHLLPRCEDSLHLTLCLWPLYAIGRFINRTSRMPSSMVILRKKSIWSNLQVLLFKGSLLVLFIIFINLCMVLSSLLKLGLIDSPPWFNSLVWLGLGSEADHSVFYWHTAQGCFCLIVYIHDIVITSSDDHGITQIK